MELTPVIPGIATKTLKRTTCNETAIYHLGGGIKFQVPIDNERIKQHKTMVYQEVSHVA